jgi:hypothetical protein
VADLFVASIISVVNAIRAQHMKNAIGVYHYYKNNVQGRPFFSGGDPKNNPLLQMERGYYSNSPIPENDHHF